tara:strand:+ start:2525 stop:3061 length:537 start_codon:yes stop_codon:yes gene_type:complete
MAEPMQTTAGIAIKSGGIPLWQFILIVAAPAFLACILTVVVVRYLHAMHIQETKRKFTIRQAVKRSMIVGAIFGPLCQWGMQGLLNFLVAMPFDYRLIILAPFVTGIASMVWFELLKIIFHSRYKSTGKKGWKRAFNWLNIKTNEDEEGNVELEGGDLTVIMNADNTLIDPDKTISRE